MKVLPYIVPLIFILLVFKQPDFGTMMVIMGITVVIFLIVPYDSKTKLIMTSSAVISVLILVVVCF